MKLKVGTMHTTLSASLEDTMVQPLSRFVNGDMAEILSMKGLYEANEQGKSGLTKLSVKRNLSLLQSDIH